MFLRTSVLAFVLLCAVSLSQAAISIEWVEVDNTAVMTGYTTVDLFVTTDSGVCCAAMLMELDVGSFYYFSLNSGTLVLEAETNQPPPEAITEISPEFAPWLFTTYVTIGGQTALLPGGGGDVGGDGLEFSDQEIDVSWFNYYYPVGRTHMGRFTFTDGATGNWGLLVVGGDENIDPQLETYGTFADIVPEPGSFALLVGGSVLMCRRLRRR